MPNNIDLITKYIPELDKVYAYMSKTALLDAPEAAIRQTDVANQIKIAKMSLQGLGDYDRAEGYVKGNVDLVWETHTFSQDRGRRFDVDDMDNQETANISFGMLSGEFVRTKSIPEFDAYRMATYANGAGTKVEADLTTAEQVLAALDTAISAMDDEEVPEEGRILFISNTMYNLLKNAPNIQRRIGDGNDKTFDRNFTIFDGMKIQTMPRKRFYTAITQYDGATAGQEAGGYIKAAAGKDLNFQIIHPSSVLQVMKHVVTKVIAPEVNQIADAWSYYFRAYHDAFLYENKTKGVYSHNATT